MAAGERAGHGPHGPVGRRRVLLRQRDRRGRQSLANAIVNATDEILARNFPHGAVDRAAIDDLYDYNRDGLVNGTDQIVARSHQTNPLNMLRLITAPAADAVLKQALDPLVESLPFVVIVRGHVKHTASEAAWLYELAQSTAKRTAAKTTPTATAVDELLASQW